MNDPRSELPAVNTLLEEAARAGILDRIPRDVVLDSVRDVLDIARREGGTPPSCGWIDAIARLAEERSRPLLVAVINATGVVLHTNLGRAPLARAAFEAAEHALAYSTLELNLETGDRGSRQDRLRALLREITGAADGLVVTNAAAAVFLLLNTLASDGETIVSRGELVEIGGSFRIPEILAKSGSTLVEVGTTNRTRLRDYELAFSPRTRLLLKVHRSNFEIVGFTEDTALDDLVRLGELRGVPVVHDVGSGLLIDLTEYGLSGEPLVRESVATGATVVFSGDKLVGGPQAGIIAGPAAVVRKAKANPLARAFRPDKFTIAALEATVALYRSRERALTEIPALAMLVTDPKTLELRAKNLAAQTPGSTIQRGGSAVGGGAFPGKTLPSTVVSVEAESPNRMLAELRHNDPPVIARVADGAVIFDVRTIREEELSTLADAVARVRGQ